MTIRPDNLVGLTDVPPGYLDSVQILLNSSLQANPESLRAVLYENRTASSGTFDATVDRPLSRTLTSDDTLESAFSLAFPTVMARFCRQPRQPTHPYPPLPLRLRPPLDCNQHRRTDCYEHGATAPYRYADANQHINRYADPDARPVFAYGGVYTRVRI